MKELKPTQKLGLAGGWVACVDRGLGHFGTVVEVSIGGPSAFVNWLSGLTQRKICVEIVELLRF